jgi:hypothetical protein
VLGLGAVGNGARRLDVHDAAGGEGLLAVVAGFGLDAVDPALRRQRPRRQRAAAEQAAAAEADE